MSEIFNEKLRIVREIIEFGPDPVKTIRIMKELDGTAYPPGILETILFSSCGTC